MINRYIDFECNFNVNAVLIPTGEKHMSKMKVATDFFHACEGLKGSAGCAEFLAPDATFTAQSEPIADITSLAGYCDWMAGFAAGPVPGCSYEIHTCAFDEDASTALFFATFTGQHTADGGPVAPTQKTTQSHYVYAITVGDAGKVSHMTKIWNANWALKDLGWT
ncbi:MAG: nuclear transport factor 2 family protein [Pseudomonadota bacterium]